jgi:type I restriction enzyme S subunit
MGSKWATVSIDDIKLPEKYSCVGGPFGSSLSQKHYVDSGVPVIRGTNLAGDIFSESSFVFVSPDKANELQRNMAFRGDIVFTQRGTLGQVALIPEDSIYERYIVSQSQMKLTVNPKQADAYFIYTYFRTNEAKALIENNAIVGGVPHINLGILKEFKLRLPPLSEQKRISEVSKSIDNKINLNRQINQTLEQMAQTLFKSWFVDFDPVIDNTLDAGNPIPEALQSRAELRQKVRNSADFKPLPADIRALFPAEFEETERGWVPRGWQTKSVHDLVESVSITFPLSKTDKVIFLNTGDIEKGSFLHQNYSKTEGLPGQAKKSIKKGDILFSEIRPENKRYAFVHFESDDYVVSTKLMVLRAKNEIHPLLPYFIITLEDNTKKLQRIAELRSGTFPQITFKELEFISFIMPNNDEIMELFINSYLAPAYNKIIETKKANINLINLRDTLLPKLISGELSLEDLPNLVNQTEPA